MIKATSALFWFSLVIITSVGVYRTSDHVQELNHELSATKEAIEAEQQSIHVLKAEWVYLANPARLESVVKKHLALRATASTQITTMDNLSNVLPLRNTAPASVAVTDTPMANVRVSMLAPQPQPVVPMSRMNMTHVTTTVASVATKPVSAPVQKVVAAISSAPKTVKSLPKIAAQAPQKSLVKTASVDQGRLMQHMLMNHTVEPSAAPHTDAIGAMLAQLDQHP